VCSGIGGCAAAWHPLGWETAFFAEIESFPAAVIEHHYAGVPNAGDFTSIKGDEYGPIELLVGGTPCQSFSVAGLRGGLSDDRGNLALEFLKLAGRTRPRWIVWENVPGVLSSESHTAPDPCAPPPPLDMGRDGQEVETEDEYTAEELHALNCFLAGLSELGYGIAYRILDAQYFGVPQRRRRIFVVGHLGDWRAAAAVLFERHSLQGHPAPSRKTGEDVTGTIGARASAGGGFGGDFETTGGLQPATFRQTELGGYVPDESASTLKSRDHKDSTDLIAFGFSAGQSAEAGTIA
jgi:DNA (cytosine-5)-methyltransferase 1